MREQQLKEPAPGARPCARRGRGSFRGLVALAHTCRVTRVLAEPCPSSSSPVTRAAMRVDLRDVTSK